MLEHLVQSHLGGYYISDGDPEDIEQYCETCGDYDMILTSWNPFEEKARLNALLRYFMVTTMNNRKDIDSRTDDYRCEDLDVKDIIPSLFYDIENNMEEVIQTISYLFEDKSISEEEYNKIMKIANFEKERQIKMIKHFSKSMFTKDEKGKVKVLKLSK